MTRRATYEWEYQTKGDILAATGDNRADNLPAGADGTILTADSGQAMGLGYKNAKPMTVEVTGAAQPMAVNTRYITNRPGGAVVFTLPAAAAVGDFVEVVGESIPGWTIAQGAGQSIVVQDVTTTVGVTGGLASENKNSGVTLVCITADLAFQARDLFLDVQVI